MLPPLPTSWQDILSQEIEKPYYKTLSDHIAQEYTQHICHPDIHDIYKCLAYTAPQDVRVVILGQDPYHTPGMANGLAFSVCTGVRIPPSLRNILKELHTDTGIYRVDTDLSDWAAQGVLLLNTCMTVRTGVANSHSTYGWDIFTDAIISALSATYPHIVYILWGTYAGAKASLIDTSRNYILHTAHPSPLSAYRGFFGSRVFSAANAKLKEYGRGEIEW